ncbi:MAG TPA: carboxypeptidase-like regulatory domain-containing protein [Planctomycetota bacterium]|nr:carboxypeptidase-like regulatory domain-containing protein [Planctomycetota bacterium]
MKSARVFLVGAAIVALGLCAWVFLAHGTSESASGIEPVSSGEAPQDSSALATPSRALAAAESASERTAATKELLEVLVLDPSGAPVPGAEVILYRSTGWLKQCATDDNGIAEFAPHKDGGNYLIAAPQWNYLSGEIDMSAGRRSVSLTEGAMVGGRVLVDGRPPPESVELFWQSNSLNAAINKLPRHVARALRQARGVHVPISTRSEADGAFRFRGLATEAHGTIRWGGPYYPEGSGKDVPQQHAVNGPSSDIELRWTLGVELRFRVVSPAGAPIPGAFASLRREPLADKRLVVDTEGRCAFAFLPRAAEKLSLDVGDQIRVATRTYDFELPPDLRGVWDVGDLATGGSRKVVVFVKDTEGVPIPFAEVQAQTRWERAASDTADSAGRAELAFSQAAGEAAVAAFGYESVRVPIPCDALEVVASLPAACMLELKLRDEFRSPWSLHLTLMTTTPLFVDKDQVSNLRREWPRTTRHRSGPAISSVELTESRNNAWRVAGLVPGKPMQAQLRLAGRVLSTTEIAPMQQGERRAVALHLDAPGTPLNVRVLSPDGVPLARSRVFLDSAGNKSVVSNASGVAEIGYVRADRCLLRLLADGFPPKTVILQPVPSGTLDIPLDHPVSVEVELVHLDGSPVEGRSSLSCDWWEGDPYARPPGEPNVVTELAPGRFRVDGLSAREVTLIARAGSDHGWQLHDARIPKLRMVVGPRGQPVGITLKGTFLFDDNTWAVAVSDLNSPRDRIREFFRAVDPEDSEAVLQGMFSEPYELWLERRSDVFPHDWMRVGDSKRNVPKAVTTGMTWLTWTIPPGSSNH